MATDHREEQEEQMTTTKTVQSDGQIKLPGMLISETLLRQIMGALWLIDGLLQLQPQMFTMNMVSGMLVPTINGQPALIADNLYGIVTFTSQYLTPINWGIAIIQVIIGMCLLSNRWVKQAIILSALWALIVWYGGEGMSMLLTGQGSILTGAPGAVLLYPLLTFTFYPREKANGKTGILSRLQLRYILAGFWLFAALLQIQPYWWQPGQISQEISAMYSPDTLSGVVIDPSLHWLAGITSGIEIPLNISLIVIFLGIGIALLFVKTKAIHFVLTASVIMILIVWWSNEALGMILTGMATDFNSGLLVIVMSLACWPTVRQNVTHFQKNRRIVNNALSSATPS